MATIASPATSTPGNILTCRINDQDVKIPLSEPGWSLLDVTRDTSSRVDRAAMQQVGG